MPGFRGTVARITCQWVSNAGRLDSNHMGSCVCSLCTDTQLLGQNKYLKIPLLGPSNDD